MNGKHSTTAKAEKLPNAKKLEYQWKHIDWKKAEYEVNRLQTRIAKATLNQNWNAVKRLQYLLTHSYYAKLLAVRKVTTNKGKRTSGVDKQLWTTSASKMTAVLTLTDKKYKSKPLRRTYIDKKGKKKKRPLGIPCMYDRAMQALYALALEPVAETTADTHSFGFRRERSCKDACKYIFARLSRKCSAEWILEGDIKGCFDHISHDWLIENIPMDKSILKQFLKSGFVFKEKLFPTEEGTPQGGIISPILANMALDGIQKMLSEKYDFGINGKYSNYCHSKSKVNFVRYADDFIVTASTKEIAEEVKELIRAFLSKRGLELSEEKTLITNINEGFDLLGWNFKKHKGKLIIRPAKKSVKSFTEKLSDTILNKGKSLEQSVLIESLNQQIRGWTNYHQSVCASTTFRQMDYVLYQLLWRWAKRRHPKKGSRWIYKKYWLSQENCKSIFQSDKNVLHKPSHTPIIRHTQLELDKNPFFHQEYFTDRKFQRGMKHLSGKFKTIWKNQNGRCILCDMPIDIAEERDIVSTSINSDKSKWTSDEISYVHHKCLIWFNECRPKG